MECLGRNEAKGSIVPNVSQEYIGRYRLLRCLREGKFCQVWEVISDVDQQRYAIKYLPADKSTKTELAFLKHEFAVGGGLDHPRVIHIHDFGSHGGGHFLVMELCAILNLKQVMQQAAEQIAPVLDRILTQCAEGLGYLHSRGWVHRDVKPDNFLSKPDGDMKLIDFALAVKIAGGLSKLLGRGAKQVQGTRSYMSPEQIRCQPLDQRADIYSFGCVCYELACGKVPFTGISTNDLLTKHLRLPPPPVQAVNNNITDEFARLLNCMMAKNPKQRLANMDEFLSELRGMRIYKSLAKIAQQ